IRVINHRKGKAGPVAEKFINLDAFPALIDISPGYGFAVVDNGRKSAANRTFPVKMFDKLIYRFSYLMGFGWHGSRDAISVRKQFSRGYIYRRTFYPRATYINSEYLHMVFFLLF